MNIRAPHLRLEMPVGQGAVSKVFKAFDLILNQTVAVKILRESLTSDPVIVSRFFNEARLLKDLQHEGIVKVFEVGEEGSVPYFTMEYCEGRTFSELISKGGYSPENMLKWMIQVLEALSYAHNRGVLHRDVKPGNLFLIHASGGVKVLDCANQCV